MRIAGFLTLALFIPAFALAASLININTADAALLDTLPGIGPAYATRIVDYRNAHGPFARIEDIQNVSGIGPSTYADIASLITVGDTDTSNASTTDTQETADSAGSPVQEQTTSSSSGSTTASAPPPPSQLSIVISGNHNAIVGVPLHMSARTTIKNGSVDPSRIIWSFGDGSSTTGGSTVDKIYRYAGTYVIVADVREGVMQAHDEMIVAVKPADVRLLTISSDGITIMNDSSERLDLSGWRLLSGTGSFRIPDGTVILPKMSVLFPFGITHLPMALDAILLYPDGIIATRFAPPPPITVAQLPQPVNGSYKVQTVEPIISKKTNVQAHEKAVGAPTAATELAAVGAAMSSEPAVTPATNGRIHALFKSPWTLGLLGVIAAAGSVFILL